MSSFVKASAAGDVKPGDAKVVTVNDKEYALFNVDGKFYCLDNSCLHRGGPLGEGFLDGTTVTCPWHGWQYDVATGQCKTNPAAKMATHEVKAEGDDVLINV